MSAPNTIEPTSSMNENVSELAVIQQKLANIVKDITTINKELKALDRTSKRSKRTKNTNTKVYDISPELAKFIGVKDNQASRQKVLSGVSQYVIDKGLQFKDNKCAFSPDDALSKLFKIDKSTKLTFLDINKLVAPYINTKKVVSETTKEK
tara:strand:+ start:427 stop:879 length:453 start_codon:yes stop_codon:yes gene_type:complete